MLIHTSGLRLTTLEAGHLAALVQAPASLGELLGVSVPDQWPGIPQSYAGALSRLREQPLLAYSGWWLYLFVSPRLGSIVGSGGFKQAPDRDGVVEIGCEIAPSFRRSGFATEAMRGLIAYAFTRPAVTAVAAHSLPKAKGPQAALARALGMQRAGEAQDPVAGKVWRWEITRAVFVQSVQGAKP